MFHHVLNDLFDRSNAPKKSLAFALGYNPSLISKWLSGAAVPAQNKAASVINQIAQFFALEITDPATRLYIAGLSSRDTIVPTDDWFIRVVFDKLNQAYKAGVEGPVQNPVNAEPIFVPNTYVGRGREEMLWQIADHIVSHHHSEDKLKVTVRAISFISKPWHRTLSFIKHY